MNIFRQLKRFNPFCRHEWKLQKIVTLELGGHSLAAGAEIGKRKEYSCIYCKATKSKTYI